MTDFKNPQFRERGLMYLSQVIIIFSFPAVPTDRGLVRSRPLTAATVTSYCWHPGALDAAIGCVYQHDHNPALVVYSCPGVGLIPLGCYTAGEAFNSIPHLHTKEAIDEDDGGG